MKKWTEGADTAIYRAVLPTDIKKYYFNLFRRWPFKNPSVIFEFRTNIFKYHLYFSLPIGNSVSKLTQSEMHLMHRPLEFAQSVGDFVCNIDPPTNDRRTLFRRSSRRWLWHFQVIFFRTICEMPTYCFPSVIMAFSSNYFLSVKCQRILFRR
jgi:hypothetical protein